jgi:flagellar biosynthesis chaperone FliJ
MPTFEFRLETVLRHQEKQKKLAKMHREQTLQMLRKIEEEIEHLQQELHRIATALQQCLGRGGVPTAWDSLHAQSRWLANLLLGAEQRVRPARIEFAKANELYKQIASLVEALHNIKQQRWREYKDAVEVKEQLRIEEFVLRHWTEVTAAARDDSNGKESP